MYFATEHQPKESARTSVLIVGAGPSGIGVATALKQAGVTDMQIIDAREIGASFLNWPLQMSLLTPSFHSNSFGLTDLNAIDPETSPADYLRTQHPKGDQYAKYLKAVATYHELPVRTGVRVSALEKEGGQFIATTNQGDFFADIVVWATGQFFSPRDQAFPGAELALHSSKVVAEPSAAGGTPNWASARSSSNSMMASSDRLAMYAHVDVGAPLSFGGGLARRTWRRRRKCEMPRGHTPVAKSANSPRT